MLTLGDVTRFLREKDLTFSKLQEILSFGLKICYIGDAPNLYSSFITIRYICELVKNTSCCISLSHFSRWGLMSFDFNLCNIRKPPDEQVELD